MSSGGDLDGMFIQVYLSVEILMLVLGDKFFVCWDPDIVPPRVHEVSTSWLFGMVNAN